LADVVEKREVFTRRYNKAVGSVVGALCRDKDLKQVDTAALLKVSARQVRRLESGQAAYTLVQLALVAREIRTTTTYILKLIDAWLSREQPPGRRK
jgi:transcriptional regulator with XRE-family HTH domain